MNTKYMRLQPKHISIFKILLFFLSFMLISPTIKADYHTPDYYEANVREHFKHDRWQQGKVLLDEGMKEYGTMSVMNELAGWYYYHFHNYDKARFHLIKSLRDDNYNTHSRELLVNVEEETKNYSSAICYVNEILQNNPYSRGWWKRKINLYRKQNNHVEADRLLRRLQQIYPNDEQIKKDINYQTEQNYQNLKKKGNLKGQIEALKELTANDPKSIEYHLAYTNALLQAGRINDALEAASIGARETNSAELIRKKASIMAEQGNYIQAINYLKEAQKTNRAAGISAMISQLQVDAANAAQLNDPYTSMGKVYESTHSAEALNYLLNTSISRGYYEDALTYIHDAKRGRGETEDLLYKEYVVQRRLGNTTTATALLNKLYTRNPYNSEVADNLALVRYEQAAGLMSTGQYGEAIPNLIFAADKTQDAEVKRGAISRLFNCYYETKQYTLANEQLDLLSSLYDYEAYTEQKARLLQQQGRIEDALAILAQEYERTNDPAKSQALAYTYEELAIPYVKSLLQAGMTRQAYNTTKKALLVCPTSIDMLHQAITAADLTNNTKGYEEFVAIGRALYPEDPFFIVKEASIYAKSKNYQEAVDLVRPELDIYPGDSTIVGSFSENSMMLALGMSKDKEYEKAIAVLDTALLFNANSNELLYTKGLIYESMHLYDSAYVYQKYYKPTLTDFREHGYHLEELLAKTHSNTLTMQYQASRPGEEDTKTANAMLMYSYKTRRNEYTGTFNYAGRDGISSQDKTDKDMSTGGTGVQLGFDWTHHFDSPWTTSIGGAWSNKYFPRWTVRGSIERNLRNDWTIGLHANYRHISTYSLLYEWAPNEDYNPADETSGKYVLIPVAWQHKYRSLISLGLTVTKTIDKFVLAGTADGFYMNKNLYWNGNMKMQFFPKEGSSNHIFAVGGLGTAPQTELLDSSMPVGFKKLNTYVGAGGLYVFNQYLSGSLSGTWYTMYRSKNLIGGVYDPFDPIYEDASTTNFKNQFYWQAQVIISF